MPHCLILIGAELLDKQIFNRARLHEMTPNVF